LFHWPPPVACPEIVEAIGKHCHASYREASPQQDFPNGPHVRRHSDYIMLANG
jgi:hypothetical protein